MNGEKTILIVDDTKENIQMLTGLLEDYDLLVALSGEKALSIAGAEKIDLILLDILMPGLDGYETCRKLKSSNKTKDIPIIFITAKTDEDSIEKAYEEGGVDYVTKPFKPRELLARVRTHLKLQSVIDHLEHISSYDQMTGIYNRRKFFELSTSMFRNTPTHLFAMMMDIDKFKNINDTYGHPTGDVVITEVAHVLREVLPDNVVLGRIGGEEFAVLLHSPSGEEAFVLIEKIRKSVENLKLYSTDGVPLSVTISGGLVPWKPEYRTLDSLLKEADDALYESKGSGRNRSIFRT